MDLPQWLRVDESIRVDSQGNISLEELQRFVRSIQKKFSHRVDQDRVIVYVIRSITNTQNYSPN